MSRYPECKFDCIDHELTIKYSPRVYYESEKEIEARKKSFDQGEKVGKRWLNNE